MDAGPLPPRAGGSRPREWCIVYDLDGNDYVDFNLCDFSMAAGFAPEPIIAAMTDQARLGNHFLLPTEDSLEVSELLAARFDLPYWQYTVSASGANVDALRLARVATGRPTIAIFDGKYHGMVDSTLWSSGVSGNVADLEGLDPDSGLHTRVLTFNDVEGVRAALASREVAAVLIEPAMTKCGLVEPSPEFVDALNAVSAEFGTLLIVDETHTQFAVWGGGTRFYGYRPDIITGGKGIAGGVSIGVYGMTVDLAATVSANLAVDGRNELGDTPGIALGGTLYGNALSMAVARAGLSEIFTTEAYERVDALGARLQSGVQLHLDKAGLAWTIDRLGGRAQWRVTPQAPANGHTSYAGISMLLSDTRKLFMANRGVWDAIITSGPSISFAASTADVDAYVESAGEFIEVISG